MVKLLTGDGIDRIADDNIEVFEFSEVKKIFADFHNQRINFHPINRNRAKLFGQQMGNGSAA